VIAVAISCFSWSALRTSVEVLPDGMRFTRGFGPTEEIPFDRIAGYRTLTSRNGTILQIVPSDASRRPISIGQTLERRKVLEKFIRERLRDQDEAAQEAYMATALEDPQLGSSTEERRAALSRAQLHSRILNVAVFAPMLWAFFYPRPYIAVIAVLAAFPLVAVALAVSSHGAISLYDAKNKVRPSVAYAFIGPTLVLALREFKDCHILGWSGFWLPFALLGGILIGVLWLGSISDPQRTFSAFLGLACVCLAQSYGLVLFINCFPDHSVPEIHRTAVLSRHISSGKHTTYYVNVGPWLDGTYVRQISVSSSFYYAHSEGSTVLVGVKKGVLQMSWFFVR
jgi:hypothetical protein